MNFEPGWGRWKILAAALSHGVYRPVTALPSVRPEVDLSSSRSQVFDREFRRSTGTDHGFENLIQVEQSWS